MPCLCLTLLYALCLAHVASWGDLLATSASASSATIYIPSPCLPHGYRLDSLEHSEDGISRRNLKTGLIQGDEEECMKRRRLSGPGSMPPNCAFKCGKCLPCKPVRVPIQPGNSVSITEYYPEAWRCKCGNKLYMP